MSTASGVPTRSCPDSTATSWSRPRQAPPATRPSSRSRRSSDEMADPFLTARDLHDAIRTGALSAEEACRSALDRIAAIDGPLHAFHRVEPERALARARALDAAGRITGPLHGVPIALKDNI